jgi:tetratricopeptide (TPR) repeat protein
MSKRAGSRAQHSTPATATDPRAEAGRLYGEGRYAEALQAAGTALRDSPQDAELWNLSGMAALELGLTQDAETFWRAAIVRNPSHADAHYNLGLLHHRRRAFDEAARAFARAITLRPMHAAALNNLGAVLQELGRTGEAVTLLEHSVAIDATNAAAFNNLGQALSTLGRFEEARTAFDRALALKGDFAEALTGRGRISMEAGERAEAMRFFEAAIAANPERAEAYYERSLLAPAARGAPWVDRLQRLYGRRAALEAAGASTVSFAMGKVREDLGEYEAAFEAYTEGNRLRYAQRPFDEAEDEQRLAALLDSFTPELYAGEAAAPAEPGHAAAASSSATSPSGAGTGQRVPILVVGMPRSGTTLIEQALASHPEVFGAGELTTLRELASTLPAAAPPTSERSVWRNQLRALGREYLARAWKNGVREQYLIDKMPGNYWQLGLVPLMVPEVKIIHVRRDPLDTCLSCYSTAFTRGHDYAFDLGALGRRYLRYHRLMAHWRSVLPPGRILEVRYEDVVADLERESRRMLAHVGLPWHGACLNFHEHRRAVRTASVTQVRQPLYSSSIGRWQRFATQLEPLRALLAPILDDPPAAASAATAAP